MNNLEEYKNALNEIKASDELNKKTMHKIKEKRTIKTQYKLLYAMSAVFVLFVGLFIFNNIQEESWYSVKTENNIAQNSENEKKNENKLPTVENFEHLLALLKYDEFKNQSQITSVNGKGDVIYEVSKELVTADLATNGSSLKGEAEATYADDSTKMSYSTTNVQVNNVYEADIVKTDGEYIYYISKQKLVIVNAREMNIVSEIVYENHEERINPMELYITDNKLIMIASKSKYNIVNGTDDMVICIDVAYRGKIDTKIIVYDILDKSSPAIYKEFEIEGDYINSRLLNNTVYVITNKYINKYSYNEEEDNQEVLLQTYNDSAVGEERCLKFEDISYLPGSEESCYLNIIAIDTESKREAEITTILGAGNVVYVSEDNIYVVRYKYENELNDDGIVINCKRLTEIYKFNIDKLQINFEESATISGHILNQFSMDEFNGNFRVAVTEYEEDRESNSLYILNEKLQEIGSIKNLAEGERIYAVRFMGERAYMVTYEQTDPLFVIDASNPTSPELMGELEMPGYSSYLHPYDATHIIGFGQDTEVVTRNGMTFTNTKGMKLAMFDVSDLSNPVEVFNTIIGETGTSSSVEYNHKALLFSREKNILAFPINLHKNTNSYRDLQFVGAIVFSIDMENGFIEKGKITHKELENGYKDYDRAFDIERIIYINDDLYTLSMNVIKKTDVNSLQEVDSIEIDK